MPKKKTYRSQAGIVYDILKALRDEGELTATRISCYARLPYDRLKPILIKLLEKNLIEEVNVDDKTYYRITSRGLETLEELEKTKKLLEALGLRF
ncbi:DUF4364 family protein [Desulfurococcaceae archaeon MEX13E-LK6-19]|nr:DUF4364 family protein [Desulfurococcaceae archaeon MEX13E-LK6-19]